jgi:hypothetical protein
MLTHQPLQIELTQAAQDAFVNLHRQGALVLDDRINCNLGFTYRPWTADGLARSGGVNAVRCEQ